MNDEFWVEGCIAPIGASDAKVGRRATRGQVGQAITLLAPPPARALLPHQTRGTLRDHGIDFPCTPLPFYGAIIYTIRIEAGQNVVG